MNPKLLITQAIQNTYDKCFPHVFTHDDFIKECDDMNKIFLKSFKTKILDSKVLAKIEKTIKIDEKDNHFYIDDYLHSVVSPASYIVNDYFYSKKLEAQALENKEHFNVLNILVEKTQNFYDNLISEIKSLNKVNYTQTEKEKAFHSHITGNSEALEYTPEELGAEFKIFSKTMKQQSLVACGDFSLSQVKTWLSGFNRESKNVMKMIGLPYEAIHLNHSINFFYDAELKTSSDNGYIFHEKGKKMSNHIISYDDVKNSNFPQTILHEWFHALDLNVGYKIFQQTEIYASNMALNFVLANNFNSAKNSEDLELLKQMGETVSQIYGMSSSKDYFNESQKKINVLNETIKEHILSVLGIKNQWNDINDSIKKDFVESLEYKSLIKSLLSSQTISEVHATAQISKNLSKILTSSIADKLNLNVKKHTVSNCSHWLLIQTGKELKKLDLNPFFEYQPAKFKNHCSTDHLVLTKSTYTKAAFLKAKYHKKDYLNLTHELLARSAQSLIVKTPQNQLSVKDEFKTPKDYMMSHRATLSTIALKPEFISENKKDLIETIHAMTAHLGIHPLMSAEKTKSVALCDDTTTEFINQRKHILDQNIYVIKKEKALDGRMLTNWEKIQIPTKDIPVPANSKLKIA